MSSTQAIGLEQRLIDYFGGTVKKPINPNGQTQLLNMNNSYSSKNKNSDAYRASATDELFENALMKIGN